MAGQDYDNDGLRNIGASWFVSYAYYEKIDRTHRNWSKVGTANYRISVYKKGIQSHEAWLRRVAAMSEEALGKNTIGLSGYEVKKMARQILEKTASTSAGKAQKPTAMDPVAQKKQMSAAARTTLPTADTIRAFETAFRGKFQMSPGSYIRQKLETGSDESTIQYLFEIMAAELIHRPVDGLWEYYRQNPIPEEKAASESPEKTWEYRDIPITKPKPDRHPIWALLLIILGMIIYSYMILR